MESKIKAILFDFDGVIVDTEPQYDRCITELGEKYELGIPDLAEKVKGTPVPEILRQYFGHLDDMKIEKVKDELLQFEITMDFPPINGSLNFLKYLRQTGLKLGLVTSSQRIKLDRALDLLGLANFFDTEVSADRITKGKPDPMCFLLAAQDLNVKPEECIVFEDSMHGINAARSANMRVIGLTTSFPYETIKDLVFLTLPDLSNVNLDAILRD